MIDSPTLPASSSGGATRPSGRTSDRPSPGLWWRAAFVLSGALLLALVVSYISILISNPSFHKTTDFISPYTAANLVVHGHGGSIYDLQVTTRWQKALVAPYQIRGSVLPFLYAPYAAVVMAPLATLPYLSAYFLWLGVNCLLLALVLFGLVGYVPLRGKDAVLWWVAGLGFLGSFVALIQGQMSMILLASVGSCFLLSWRPDDVASTVQKVPLTGAVGGDGRLDKRAKSYLYRHSEELAGAALAFGLVKAPYLFPLLLVFLLRRRWRTLTAFVLVALALFALPTAIFGISADTGYLHSLFYAAQSGSHIGGYDPEANNSFVGFTHLLVPAAPAAALTIVLDIVALLFVARSALEGGDIDIPLGLATVVAVLVAPHVLTHDLVLLLIPAAVVLHNADRVPAAGWMLGLSYAGIVVGFVLVSHLPLQVSVIAMCLLAATLIRAAAVSGPGEESLPSRCHTQSPLIPAQPFVEEVMR